MPDRALFSKADHLWIFDHPVNTSFDIRGRSWPIVNGTMSSTHGPNNQAIHLNSDAKIILLNEVDAESVCLADPVTCKDGFTIAFWIKYSNSESKPFVQAGGSSNEQKRGVALFRNQSESNILDQLTFEVTVHTMRCYLTFQCSSNLWVHLVFRWRNADEFAVYKNGRQGSYWKGCETVLWQASASNTFVLAGKASFDDFIIWEKYLARKDFMKLYPFYQGKVVT